MGVSLYSLYRNQSVQFCVTCKLTDVHVVLELLYMYTCTYMCTCSSNIIMNPLPVIKVLLKITNLSPVVWGSVLFISITYTGETNAVKSSAGT